MINYYDTWYSHLLDVTITPDGVEVCSQWSSLAVFTQVTDHLLGGDYNFNLRGTVNVSVGARRA